LAAQSYLLDKIRSAAVGNIKISTSHTYYITSFIRRPLSMCANQFIIFPFSVIAANAMPGICTQCQTCAWQNVVSARNLTQNLKAFFLLRLLYIYKKFLNVIGFSFFWENEGYSLIFSLPNMRSFNIFCVKKCDKHIKSLVNWLQLLTQMY
jgi:hypothetical protein